MAFETSGQVEIDAPPAEVFPWLIERDRIARWVGGDTGLFPRDASELHVGYRAKGQFQGPDGMRDVEIEITAYDPPHGFDFRQTYAGGQSIGSYRLTESGSGTRLQMTGKTDYAAAAKIPVEVEQQIEQQMEHLPAAVREFARSQLEAAEKQLEHPPEYGYVGEAMQKQLDAELTKLKQLVETQG